MIEKIDHLVITTAQPQKCMEFYEKLGFQSRNDGGRYELFAGDFKINVHIKNKELLPHAAVIQPGSADLCFEITHSLEAFKVELEEKGIPLANDIVLRTGVRGSMHSLYIRDPDGNLLEFCSYQ